MLFMGNGITRFIRENLIRLFCGSAYAVILVSVSLKVASTEKRNFSHVLHEC